MGESKYNYHTALTLTDKHVSLNELSRWLKSTLGKHGEQWELKYGAASSTRYANSYWSQLVLIEFVKESHKMLFDLRWEGEVRMHYKVTNGEGPAPSTMMQMKRYGG